MTTKPTPTPAPALPFPWGPAPAPRPPAAVAGMARSLATDYAAKADNILDGDGAYGGALVDELVGVLAGLAEELDRYQEAAVDQAVALLTPCQPPDAADAVCHPGESWPCSRTHAAWALRGWDADAQVDDAVRRWRFRAGAPGRRHRPAAPMTADRSPELAAGVLAGIQAAELRRALTDLARRMDERSREADSPADGLAMSDYVDEIRDLVAKATPADPAAGDDPARTIARAAARSAVEYVPDEGWFPHDTGTEVPDACADAVLAALSRAGLPVATAAAGADDEDLCPVGDPSCYAPADAVHDACERTPSVVALCGSTRFKDDYERANRSLTLGGHIVLAPGVFGHADGIELSEASKEALDALHLRKIDLADVVVVVNPGGYIGESTRNEIAYAQRTGKPIDYLYGEADDEPERPGAGEDQAAPAPLDELTAALGLDEHRAYDDPDLPATGTAGTSTGAP